MPQPLVSILMTVYNREKYLATAIESVLAQSMEDFELIIVDDGSKDHSLDIAKRYKKDSRVQIYPNKRNIGQFPTRNRAASFATGKYLKYVDSDDAIYPHCLEVMTHMMERHPQAGMLLCAWSENDPFYPFELSPMEAYRRCFIHGERMSNSPLNTMFRKDAFDQVGRYEDDKWPLSGDWDIILKVARQFHVLFAPIGLTFYRVHEGQIIKTTKDSYLKHFIEGLVISLEALWHSDCPLPENEKRWAIGRLLRGALMYAGSLILKRRLPLDAIRFLKNLATSHREWTNLYRFRKPMVSCPNLGGEPDWADYPRSRVDRLNNANQPDQINNGVSIIIAGQGSTAEWEKTIRSALVQSEASLEVIVVSSPHCSNPPLELAEKYPFVHLINRREDNIWIARNRAAEESRGAYLKFVEPGILLYPYAAEFHAYPLRSFDDSALVAWGQLQCVPHLLRLDEKTAISCDFKQGYNVFRIPISNAVIRRSSFMKKSGFDHKWKLWSAYELFFRLALDAGIIHGMLGHSQGEIEEFPGPASEMPFELQEHIEKLIQNYFGNPPNSKKWQEILPIEADNLLRKAVAEHKWDWDQYPWSQTNKLIVKA